MHLLLDDDHTEHDEANYDPGKNRATPRYCNLKKIVLRGSQY